MAFDLVGKAVKKIRLPTVNYENTPIKIIPAQTGDVNSRFLVVEFYDDRGTIDLSPYSSVTLNATLISGAVQVTTGEIDKANNTATVKIASSMLANSGKITCDIALGGSDAYLTSQPFYVFVRQSQISGDTSEATDEYSLISSLLRQVSEMKDDVGELDNTVSANEQQRQTNEQTRQAQEAARVAAEGNRAAAEEARATAEEARVAAEEDRIAAEEARVAAEEDRVAAEEARVDEFETAKTECDEATARANGVADVVTEQLSILQAAAEIVSGDETSQIVLIRSAELSGGS